MNRSIIVAALLFIPSVVLAAPQTFSDLANLVVVILNNATVVLIVAGLAIYFWGIATNILKFGDEGWEKAKAYFLWGLIVLFIMVSVWGILAILQDTVFGAGQGGTSNPTTSSGSSNGFQSPQFQSTE